MLRSCIVLVALLSLALLPAGMGQDEAPAAAGGEAPAAGGAAAGGAGADASGDAAEDYKKELAALKEKLAAAEARARAAEEGAKAAEAELQKSKEVALAKETELTKKATELEKALSEQRTAAQAIKDASGDAATLSQAKAGLEGKIKELEGVIASMSTASSTDTNKVGALEAELEAMKGKLSAEKEAQRLVVKLRQEKEELKQQLEEAKNNVYHQAQTVWIPQAQESFRNLTEVASTHASKAASTIQEVYSEAEKEVMKGLDSLDKHEQMETVREAAKPWLAEGKNRSLKFWNQMKEQVRYPLPELRDGVRSSVADMGALARYKEEFAEAADYWLVICPLIFVWLLVATSWMNRELRMFCLRVQQLLFGVWFAFALLALLHRTSTLALFADTFTPPQLAAFHMIGALHYAIVCAFYLLCVLFGPNRFAAVLQLGGSAWVLLCYYPQLVAPVLADPSLHFAPAVAASFTTPHFFRLLFSLVLAFFGHTPLKKAGGKSPIRAAAKASRPAAAQRR